jgi:hypothetical protein
MARIPGVNPSEIKDGYIGRVFAAQAKKWGAPLLNHLVYARLPALFKGVRGMWNGLSASGLIDPALSSLINRRVAAINGCVF